MPENNSKVPSFLKFKEDNTPCFAPILLRAYEKLISSLKSPKSGDKKSEKDTNREDKK